MVSTKNERLPSFKPQTAVSGDAPNLISCAKMLGLKIKKVAVTNPELKKTTIPFIFPDAESSLTKRLREDFDFCRVVKNKDEFKAQMALVNWIFLNVYWPRSGSLAGTVAATGDPIEVLELSRKKTTGFWCGHFGHVYAACANAAGFTARHLGIDSLHTKYQDSTHHGTSEIYSTSFRKWFLIDSMHNCFYTKNKIPLNAYEIAAEWIANKGKDVHIYDCSRKEIKKSHKRTLNNQHESSAYYFFFADMLMDPFHKYGNAYPYRMLFFRDKERAKHIWYQGPGGKTNGKGSFRHSGYSGAFMFTDRLDDFYFDVNTVHVKVRPIADTQTMALSFETFTPNFSHFLYKINGGAWRKFSGRRPWNPREGGYCLKDGKYNVFPEKLPRLDELGWEIRRGSNSFEVKPVNLFGKEGAASSFQFAAE